MKSQGRPGEAMRRRGAALLAAAALAIGLALVGVMPTAPTAAFADESDEEATIGFTAQDSGLLPDTTWNTRYVNAANRGCNSCHTDLNDVMDAAHAGLEYDHPVTRVGFSSTYNATILDGCLSCHAVHTADYGNYFADAIHVAHYGSEAFTDTFSGNCWSCHAITETSDLTALGTWSFKLWEEVKYDAGLGGFPDTATNAATREFLKMRGHETGTVTDVQMPEGADITVDMYQDVVTDTQDMFTAVNHSGAYGEEDLYDTSHTLTITGVKNPTTFTYEELAAMPQEEVTATNQCVVAGSAGHNIYNATYTGVSLKTLVELCGGLEDGVNQVYVEAWDEWNNCYPAVGCEPLDEYLDAGLIALKINGEDLPYDLGGPMLLVSPGMGGAFWTKWPQTIEFQVGEEPFDFVEAMGDVIPGDVLNYVSGAWFENDGLEFALGESVELTGYAYALAGSVAALDAIEFSVDQGATWTRVEVPEDFDPYQWVQFDFSWTPDAAGTYVVKVRGVNENGSVNVTDGSIIVLVTDEGEDESSEADEEAAGEDEAAGEGTEAEDTVSASETTDAK